MMADKRDKPEQTEAERGAELAEKAVDSRDKDAHADIEEQLEQLTPEQARMFIEVLELTMKKRRIMLTGYFLALVTMILGMMWALYMYGTREPGTFVGWVFFVPFAIVGLILWSFGRWSKQVGKKQPAPRHTEDRRDSV